MITSRSAPAFATCGFTLLAVALVVVIIQLTAPDYAGIRAGRVDAGYLESNNCRKCHEGNYATWHATFHRTMTQEANLKSVLGDFEHDYTITYQGVRAQMVRDHGRYWMKFTGVDGKKQQLEIGRTVGSRRIQQYLTKNGDQWVRPFPSCSAPLEAGSCFRIRPRSRGEKPRHGKKYGSQFSALRLRGVRRSRSLCQKAESLIN